MKLFVIILRYIVDKDAIDEARPAHISFLDTYYEKGNFIVSGRQNPANGGIIITKAKNYAAVQDIIKYDPFYINKLAEYSIYEFNPTKFSPEAAFLSEFI